MRVLVVEDAADAAEPLAAFLTLHGHDLRMAHDADDALRVAATFRPDLALVDIGLPATDGWVLGGLLRALPGLADLPLIAMTGYSQPADYERSRAAGFQHHLVKPLDYAVLLAVMKAFEPASDAPPPLAADEAVPVLPAVAPRPVDEPLPSPPLGDRSEPD